MARNQRLIISVTGSDDEYLKAFDAARREGAYEEILFKKDLWFGPLYGTDEFLDSLEAYGQDVFYADPVSPSDLFVVRGEYAAREAVAKLLREGFPGFRSIPELALPLEGIADPLHFMPLLLLEKKILPYVRKDLFFRDHRMILEEGALNTAGEVLGYIRNNTDFDEREILRELIRDHNMADLKKDLPLDRVISEKTLRPRTHKLQKIALRLHLYYEDEAAFCRHYIENMPEGTDVYITVPDEAKKASAEKAFEGLPYRTEFRVVGNRGRDISAFLTGISDIIYDYDLICVVHDKKVIQAVPRTIGASWGYLCFENLLANRTYVENVIAEFENDPFLGMLQPPLPVHSVYYPVVGKGEWSGCADLVQKTAEMLDIHVDIDPEKEPVAPLGDMFWVRPEALKNFFDHNWVYEDFPAEPLPMDRTLLHAIERSYQFAVQEAGYYNAWALSESYARIYIDNLVYMNDENIREIMKRTGPGSLSGMLSALTEQSKHRYEDHTWDDLKAEEEDGR